MKTTRIFLNRNNQAVSRSSMEAYEEIERVMPSSFMPNGQTIEEIEKISTKEVARRNKAKENRDAKNEAMASIGMVRVKGNLGGNYWE